MRNHWIIQAGLLCAAISAEAAIIADLQTDYSRTQNPNGAWSYNGGSSPLGYVPNWGSFGPSWTAGGADLAWTQTPYTSTSAQPGLSFVEGDILVHASDGNSTFGVIRPANVTWTSPVNTVVDITGGTWLAVNFGDRGSVWSIWLNNVLLTSGTITSFSAYNHYSPFDFAAGSGGAAALTGISLHQGDVVKLQFDKTSRWGAMNGVSLTIAEAIPDTASCGTLLCLAMVGLSLCRWRLVEACEDI